MQWTAMKRRTAAMIIALSLIGPAQAQLFGGGPVRLPDPVTFANEMELGNVDRASEWLDAGLPVDFQGARIGSGLAIGAWEGKIDLMRLFISRGADINMLNANGESPLALAAFRGQFEAVKWLLERGARINAPKMQWSALHYAVFNGHKDIAEFLMAQGADINARTTNGSSALMLAAREGREELARTLIEKGADRSVKNDWGDGAMEWAMRYNRLGIAKMVSSPEEFNIAVSQPKEKWGKPARSMANSPELDNLFTIRRHLVERGLAVDKIDRRIAAELARIVRAEMAAEQPAARASALEITADRANPSQQSAKVVQGTGQTVFKVPAATYQGKPKMPPKGPVRNY